MKNTIHTVLTCLFVSLSIYAQSPVKYEVSFKNAVHHEAEVSITYMNISADTLSLRMSRTSPGRYAIHDFAKNIYAVKAEDEKGKRLNIDRPNPHQWNVTGHQGTVTISYTIFANHGDGTYSQIDESHAHLNIPATFMYAPSFEKSPVHIKFHLRQDLNWKVATQLKMIDKNEYSAPDLDFFMDSPVEISDHGVKSFLLTSNGKEYKINFVLHQTDNLQGFDDYFEKVKKIVDTQIEVFGELPDFDFGSYTFLACYLPHVDGDGMEHRNSTILTGQTSLSNGGAQYNIGTVAHEFFHAWNVERIRPASLEPFDYTDANMSGALWFAEGFTSYYTYLSLCRAGILSKESYATGLSRVLNSVWQSPARTYFNPVEMSYQAPFVDAATSVDQVNRENTFISYYSYGNALGLALDLMLRNLKGDKNLDGYMKLVWENHGKKEIPYSLQNLEDILSIYAGKEFSSDFFKRYIYDSQMPDYKTLLASVGIVYSDDKNSIPRLGATIENIDNKWVISSNPEKGSSSYKAGLSKGDKIISIDGKLTNNRLKPAELLRFYQAGDSVKVVFNRFGKGKETMMVFEKNKNINTQLEEKPHNKAKKRRKNWLKQ